MIQKSFNYQYVTMSELGVETETDPGTGKRLPVAVTFRGESVEPTERFWTSLYARYGFNQSFFKYFEYPEVFTRISQVQSRDQLRLCVETDLKTDKKRLLATSNPSKPFVSSDDLITTIMDYDGQSVTYSDGLIESTHTPRSGAGWFEISGDNFANRFILSTPIDGYGMPNIYLSMLRQVCSNGMVGYSRAFRSSLAVGRGDDDVMYSITRALDGFNNEEGFGALRQRFESATRSWASVREAISLYKLLNRLSAKRQLKLRSPEAQPESASLDRLDGKDWVQAFHDMTGDIQQTYGIANLDALSPKRQRTLPIQCSVYDLLNFGSEVATHRATTHATRTCHGWLGTLVSSDYDLEGTREKIGDFQDFFLAGVASA